MTATTEQIKTRGKMRASKLHAGLLIRKPKPYSGYSICEWTRIARIERVGGDVVLYGTDGYPVDTFTCGGIEMPSKWSANSTFEIGQLADDEAEQEARTAATSPAIRGWHKPRSR
jgi:hypothetical protein